MIAYRHVHLYLPHNTVQMLDSGKLRRIPKRNARMGDLAFYGTGHVELYAGKHSTFGALNSGTLVGWHHPNSFWHPTAYYRVRGANRR